MFSLTFLRKTSLSINQDSGFEVSVSSATKFFSKKRTAWWNMCYKVFRCTCNYWIWVVTILVLFISKELFE